MRILGLDWLLTYSCDRACPHCFFDTRRDGPVLPASLVDRALGNPDFSSGMFFQHISGGEPSLHDRELRELARELVRHGAGEIGVSTNGRWAVDETAASRWVAEAASAGVTGISVSLDELHGAADDETASRAARAVRAAGLGRHSWLMASREPSAVHPATGLRSPDEKACGRDLPRADVIIRPIGRGSHHLRHLAKPGIPDAPCSRLSECLGERSPFEPAMAWIDPYGNVSICYGLVIGNLHEAPLADIVADYRPDANPVLSALSSSGPAGLLELARDLGLDPAIEVEAGFVDECDLCWRTRKALRPAFPRMLGPDECYPG